MALFGHWLAIQCYKHDGSLHRCWDRGLVLANNDDYIVIATKKAKVIESNGRRWFTKEPAVTIFSKNEWWNVICMFKGDDLCYYCNIASPSIVETHTIKYIDYDLDVKLFPDGELKILDENEYKRHREKYNYHSKERRQFRKVVSASRAYTPYWCRNQNRDVDEPCHIWDICNNYRHYALI